MEMPREYTEKCRLESVTGSLGVWNQVNFSSPDFSVGPELLLHKHSANQ
jgi:hypothetical protein